MYIIGSKRQEKEGREETPKMCTKGAYHKDTTTKPEVPPLNHHQPRTFVATYIHPHKEVLNAPRRKRRKRVV